MIKLLIIADDFTGSLDTGVQFSKKGIPTLVTIKPEISFEEIDGAVEVLVFDTESRHTTPEEAGSRVERIVRKAKAFGIEYFYKKTDSTLRGNIGIELEAAVNACGSSEIMFVPAYPQTDRTTVNGRQFLKGVPLEDTAFGKDPFNPVSDSYIPSVIAGQSSLDAVVIKEGDYDKPFPEGDSRKTVYIFDCEREDQLRRIGSVLKKAGKLECTAGCAGFAGELPGLLGLGGRQENLPESNDSFLVISGSVNDIALRQLNWAENSGYSSFTLKPEQKLEDGYWDTAAGSDFVDKVAKIFKENGKLIIKVIDSREDMKASDDYAIAKKLDPGTLHGRIAANMGKLASAVLKKCSVGNLVVFGGDTVIGIMNSLGCDGIYARDEIVPGVVISRLPGEGSCLNLITKAGGFGEADVIGRISDYLRLG